MHGCTITVTRCSTNLAGSGASGPLLEYTAWPQQAHAGELVYDAVKVAADTCAACLIPADCATDAVADISSVWPLRRCCCAEAATQLHPAPNTLQQAAALLPSDSGGLLMLKPGSVVKQADAVL